MSYAPGPEWAEQLKRSYLAGGASLFILHGNVADTVGSADASGYTVEPVADFLTRRFFGGYDLVLHYDMGRGLRPSAAGDPRRLTRMNALLGRTLGTDANNLPRDPVQALRALDRLVSLLLVGEDSRTRKSAFIFDYAELICGADDRAGEALATFLNWARSPVIRRVNLVFMLMTESLARIHPALVQSGHTEEIEIPLPNRDERRAFIAGRFPQHAHEADRLATLSAGLTLVNLEGLMRLADRGDNGKSLPEGAEKTPDAEKARDAAPARTAAGDARLAEIKKRLMEAQCPGLIEFVQPRFDLSAVAGHTAAKQRLLDDARLMREGRLDAVPMGYLLCGPVGVGKTFLALCYAGSAGIPCVTIRNFRSKYVGETEANLEKILSVVRELGPVAVIVDEADAALGNRGASGDSGTSARVFAQIAAQMGNTEYRGRIVWFLLTCRPDLLPVDLKRQGRCEEHIPLFYPQTPDELRDMFLAMARKAKLDLTAEALPDLDDVPPLSGADIEGVLMRVRRESLLRQVPVDAPLIDEVLKTFRSSREPAHELQTLAAIAECSDMRYLPENTRRQVDDPEDYETLLGRLRELQALEAYE